MSLAYGILGVLTAGPMSGYDVSLHFRKSVGGVWHASHSHIYAELRKLEKQGYVEKCVSVSGKRRIRKIYSITSSGRKALIEWVMQPPSYEKVRDEPLLKVLFLDMVPPHTWAEILRRHKQQYEQLLQEWENILERLQANTHPLMLKRQSNMTQDEYEVSRALKIFVFLWCVERARGEIARADAGLKLLTTLSSKRTARTPSAGDLTSEQL